MRRGPPLSPERRQPTNTLHKSEDGRRMSGTMPEPALQGGAKVAPSIASAGANRLLLPRQRSRQAGEPAVAKPAGDRCGLGLELSG